MSAAVSAIEHSPETLRVPVPTTDAERRARAERDADAARWLTRRGHTDLLPMLGLGPLPCEVCGAQIRNPAKSQGMCLDCRREAGLVPPTGRPRKGGAR
ncbi:hypothetical protein [Rhizomonospora bruguierae]|uniref:hypothetical protein n=1 Tax=Rhizomonospora bruguierae TaxID=1581705 RepID=UPI001BD08C39|nr:hypothetical protein [Micromonospora sp. NBRC 107566]